MKRSVINEVVREATAFFKANGWALPKNPRWDVTDFGLGDFKEFGLVLINLAEEKEYCEKLMYARKDMVTPAHTHKLKKEDIICRTGSFAIRLWPGNPLQTEGDEFKVQVSGQMVDVVGGEVLEIEAGERITLTPGIYHEFWPITDQCIIGEVSTANDDVSDNYFINPDIGRFAEIDEDEPAIVKLVSDK